MNAVVVPIARGFTLIAAGRCIPAGSLDDLAWHLAQAHREGRTSARAVARVPAGERELTETERGQLVQLATSYIETKEVV